MRCRADFTRDLSVRDWLPKLAGIDAVINAVGIVREHGAQTFESIHKRAPQALFTACVAAGVRRIVQISALGADRGMTRYFLSKRAADDYLATLPLEWTIVRPAMVFGPGASSARLFAKLARLPLVPLPGRGEQRVQPLHIDDLTEALVHLLGGRVDASRAHRTGRAAIVQPARAARWVARRATHLSPPRFLPVPMPLVRAAAHIAASADCGWTAKRWRCWKRVRAVIRRRSGSCWGGRRGPSAVSERRVTTVGAGRRLGRQRTAAHRDTRAPSK